MKIHHSPSAGTVSVLPREVFSEVILVLRVALPRPLTEEPAEAALRDRAAMAAVAALLPENAAEGRLAAQFVAADAWAMDCLQLAQEKRLEPAAADRCRAQAMGMMREGKSALRALHKLQAMRRAMEADEAAAERAAWVAHAAARMMAEALDGEDAAGVSAEEEVEVAAGVGKFGWVSRGVDCFAGMRVETDLGVVGFGVGDGVLSGVGAWCG